MFILSIVHCISSFYNVLITLYNELLENKVWIEELEVLT